MNFKVLDQLARPSAAAACAGVLLAAVLIPATVLGQAGPPTMTIPGGGGWAIPMSAVPSGPVYPWAGQNTTAEPDTHYGNGDGFQGNGRACLQAHMLSGVVASDDRQVILRFGRDDFYRVRLSKACPALVMTGANVAGVTRSTGGIICDAYDIQLKVVAGDGSVSHCTGATLKRMTTPQIAAASAPAHP